VEARKPILLAEEGSDDDFAGLPEEEARQTGLASRSLGHCGAAVTTTEGRTTGGNRRSAIAYSLARFRAARGKEAVDTDEKEADNKRQQTPTDSRERGETRRIYGPR